MKRLKFLLPPTALAMPCGKHYKNKEFVRLTGTFSLL
jgi:hypothetical protein